ncbi:MAG: tetratricopeptide repeat protein [Myxococcota bacterium]
MMIRARHTESRNLYARCVRVAGRRVCAGAWLTVVLSVLAGCSPSRGSETPGGSDPERQAVAEYDLAKDLFLARGNARSALKHALKAAELDEDNAEANHLVALIYLFFCATSEVECRLEEAERYARLALEANEDLREAKNTLGVVLIHQKRYDEAIEVLEPLTKDMLYPTPETAWGNLGWAYLLRGDTTQAIEALTRSLALQPDFCVGGYRLGLAYEKKGDYQAALEAFTRALETDRPECRGLQDAYRARARVEMRLGNRESAKDDLERCRDLDDETESGRECAAILAKFK